MKLRAKSIFRDRAVAVLLFAKPIFVCTGAGLFYGLAVLVGA
ncbi:MAG: hypothetical protein P8R42_14010 [Candidatus Binatia bacterium]|nr:hypothetical protein [Candidatus Binatia bacterium]